MARLYNPFFVRAILGYEKGHEKDGAGDFRTVRLFFIPFMLPTFGKLLLRFYSAKN